VSQRPARDELERLLAAGCPDEYAAALLARAADWAELGKEGSHACCWGKRNAKEGASRDRPRRYPADDAGGMERAAVLGAADTSAMPRLRNQVDAPEAGMFLPS
jgi:hypothetical protein